MFARILVLAVAVAVVWAAVAGVSTAAGPERTYTVQAGDTLWTIAAVHYGGDPRGGVWKITRRNGLPSGTIHAGQRLVLP